MKTISLLIPAYNEEAVLPTLHQRLEAMASSLPSYHFEFLFINDGSRDTTVKVLREMAKKDKKVSYIDLSRNFGKEIAMIAGLDNVSGDATIILDADLQDPPELIPEMIGYWEDGYDDVYAKRRSRAGESFMKKQTSRWFYKILQKSTNIPIQRDTGDFRLLSRRAVDSLKEFRESERYTKGMFSWIGYKKKEILYDRDPRFAGKTQWNYYKLFNLAIDGIMSFTTTPLRISSVLGFIVSFLAFIYIVFLVIKTVFFGNDLAGYPSLMAAILFLGGTQLLSIGIIGEYVGRIFIETKERPLYFINEFHKFKKTN